MGIISWPLRKAIAMYQDGQTDIIELSRAVGMGTADIRRALRRRGYEVASVRSGRKRHPEKWAKIAEMYGRGMGVNQIGLAVGMHHCSVTYAVKTMASQEKRGFSEEIVRRERVKRAESAEAKYQRIVDMYQSGRSTNQVGEAFNLDPSAIVKILQRMEVRARSRSTANKLRAKKEAARKAELAETKLVARAIERITGRRK